MAIYTRCIKCGEPIHPEDREHWRHRKRFLGLCTKCVKVREKEERSEEDES